MAVLFISDLHLCAWRPEINRIFFDFLRGPARSAESLYILGDLFEYWIGDDDLGDPFNASVAAALKQYAQGGPTLSLMQGNRDLLLGDDFAAACNASLIVDPYPVELYGTPTLLMHGDTLCTDDRDYQRFRAESRTPARRKQFLSQPLTRRKEEIEELRRRSESEKKLKTAEIMDVNDEAVETVLREHDYPRLIHGHTHRPARHEHLVDGRKCERWVLADWYRSGSYLRCDERGCASVRLP
ncbi:MAG TPA: UDP-2,3-diacylglucosamine diphosphatase [Burkholderiales bacterium]|nr:UDP-2,3-diacylglucosamine diphosphatase [Burkholderiales bacterium]